MIFPKDNSRRIRGRIDAIEDSSTENNSRLLKGQKEGDNKKAVAKKARRDTPKKKKGNFKRNSKRGRRVLDELDSLEVSEFRQPDWSTLE